MNRTDLSPLDRGVRPIVKWAGGKRKLLSVLLEVDPGPVRRYFEPFLGGGAMMLAMPNTTRKFLCDSNPELLNLYRTVRDYLPDLLESLRKLDNTKETYLAIRAWDRKPNFLELSDVQRAARFLFLNRTGFNGLYRVNSSGYFNVPYGSYANPRIVDEKNLTSFSAFLNERKWSRLLTNIGPAMNFSDYLDRFTFKRGDLVYLDPPYAPMNKTSSFVSYQAGGFGEHEQKLVMLVAKRIDAEGGRVMISNSAAEMVKNLYEEILSPLPNFKIGEIEASRLIAAKSSSRTPAKEIVIRNY